MTGLSDLNRHYFAEGTHRSLYNLLGASLRAEGGAYFSVWAPNAAHVSVIGDFNQWDVHANPLQKDATGIWYGCVDSAGKGQCYQFHIQSQFHEYRVNKSDPFALHSEVPPAKASVLWDLDYQWHDQQWLQQRKKHNALDAPTAVYEVHLGSWRRHPGEHGEAGRLLTYRELAEQLTEYLVSMHYTHVELMPVMEHPFYGSWGYQITGYFAPSARQGTPQDFMFLIDSLHRAGIAVWLDWVPSHFPNDEHGLSFFDGTHLFEHADPRQGFHPEWQSCIFNYGRNEVRAFLISNALFWLDKYHIDGLRVDAVASMLYLDYGREEGEWIPNEHGGHENHAAVQFLRELNTAAYAFDDTVQIIAEESTAWPQVSRPVWAGGLGFGMKWNMGWMHDTLRYMREDPIHRRYHHHELTFSLIYAFSENFLLPLSHDEVVYGKGSLLNKMPGDDWQRFANLRLLLGYMWGHPGKKLLFMGGDFGQEREWNHDRSLDWHLLESPAHNGIRHWMQDLNRLYRQSPALYQYDFDPAGFHWVIGDDSHNSVLAFLRRGITSDRSAGAISNRDAISDHSAITDEDILVMCNFTPIPQLNYRVGVPGSGLWRELLNSDDSHYGGSGMVNPKGYPTQPFPGHGFYHSIHIDLPPLGVVFLRREGVETA